MPVPHDLRRAKCRTDSLRSVAITFRILTNLAMDAVSDSPLDWPTADAIEGTSGPGTLMDSALNAANHLHGLSLIEAFKKLVLNDPEVVALSKPVVAADNGHAAVFRDGQAPGPGVDFHWPLDSTASAIAFRFVESFLTVIGDPIAAPSPAIFAVSEVLADRIARMRDFLASGEIAAFGTFVLSGLEVPIGRLQWTRSGISIDVSNGDLCEGQDHRAVPKWTGVSLRLPHDPVPAKNGGNSNFAEIPTKAREQIQTKENCRLECVAWLTNIMSASRKYRTQSKKELWAIAQSRWPEKFGWRAFETSWAEAVVKAKAPAWSAAGRPRKSPHS
jgi:hypothetical protein